MIWKSKKNANDSLYCTHQNILACPGTRGCSWRNILFSEWKKRNTINAAKSQKYVVILMMKITKSILQPVVSFNKVFKVSWGKLNLFSGSWGYPLITAFKINRSFREACISNSWLQCIFLVLSLVGKQMILKKWKQERTGQFTALMVLNVGAFLELLLKLHSKLKRNLK